MNQLFYNMGIILDLIRLVDQWGMKPMTPAQTGQLIVEVRRVFDIRESWQICGGPAIYKLTTTRELFLIDLLNYNNK